MDAMASKITSLTIVYSTVYLDADQRKYQRSASLAFVRGINRWPLNSPHKGPVTRKMFPFDYVFMYTTMFRPLWEYGAKKEYSEDHFPVQLLHPKGTLNFLCWHHDMQEVNFMFSLVVVNLGK